MNHVKNQNLLLCALLLIPSLIPSMSLASVVFPTLESLICDFDRLPKNRHGATGRDSGFMYKLSKKEDQLQEFMKQISAWMAVRSQQMAHGSWARSNQGVTRPGSEFFDWSKSLNSFLPYAEQHIIDKGQQIIMRGDLHGDISSLVAQLKSMKKNGLIGNDYKLKQGVVMAFLGDYVDRGKYGVEVLYVLALLGIANPKNVWYVRGNHEDIGISSRYGFKQEVEIKFDDVNGKIHEKISRMYDFMPVVIYVGDGTGRYVQLCHGGIEQGYDPLPFFQSKMNYQLLGALNRGTAVYKICQNPNVAVNVKQDMNKIINNMEDGLVLLSPIDSIFPLGFMWNDFNVTGKGPTVEYSVRGLTYGPDAVDVVLSSQQGSYNIMAIFRAHQHSTEKNDVMMQKIMAGEGLCSMHESGGHGVVGAAGDRKNVYTLNVAPDSVYGEQIGFDYDTSITLMPYSPGPWKYLKQKYFPFGLKDVDIQKKVDDQKSNRFNKNESIWQSAWHWVLLQAAKIKKQMKLSRV